MARTPLNVENANQKTLDVERENEGENKEGIEADITNGTLLTVMNEVLDEEFSDSDDEEFLDSDDDIDFEAIEALHKKELRDNPFWVVYDKKIDEFFECLNRRGIMARSDYSCCNTCGDHDINNEHKKEGSPHYAFVFYHIQTSENVEENLSLMNFRLMNFHPEVYNNINDVMSSSHSTILDIHLNWGFFDEEMYCDDEYDDFAERMEGLAKKYGMEIEYDKNKKISSKLVLKMDCRSL